MRYPVALVAVVVASVASLGSAQTMFFDFGRTDLQADPSTYNNMVPATVSIPNAIDSAGNPTGISVVIADPLFNTGEPSRLGTEMPTGDAAQFLVEATDDYFIGHTTSFAGAGPNPLGVFEFNDLDPSKVYRFTIFASRTGITDTRDALYEVVGARTVSGVLNASNNDSEVLVLPAVAPDRGRAISLRVSPGPNNDNANGFFYIGAVRVDGALPSEPCGALLFDFGRTDLQANPSIYNNFTVAMQSIPNAVDTNGSPTVIDAVITDPFFNTGETSQLGTEAPTGDAAQFAVAATDDYFFGHTTPFAGADPNTLGVVEFRNLDPANEYTFTVFASRTSVTDTRDALYEATGANSASGVLNASNNNSEVVVLPGIVPDSAGVIALSTAPGPNNNNTNGFFYIGAVRIDIAPGQLCPCDIDGEPGVDVFDLLEYLDCWFQASAGQPCP